MKFVVTGATGYIGERLILKALSLGHEVISASRCRPATDIEWLPYDLFNDAIVRLPDGTDAVFHLAASTTPNAINSEMELDATKRLIKAAEKSGAKLIFVSSQTAREDAPTAYGRTKWHMERLVLAAGGWVIRPGQVYGGGERALFGKLVAAVRYLPVLPAFLPSPKVQPIHVDDLAVALLNCAGSADIPPAVFCIGASEPVSFIVFLRAIARSRLRRYRPAVPFPVALVRLTGVLLGRQMREKLGLDRLTSLFDLPAMQTAHDLQLLGVALRPLISGMTRSGNARRKALIREGQALLEYALRSEPTTALVRRYVRSIEFLRDGIPLELPVLLLSMPVTIALLDCSAARSTAEGRELAWRLNAAVVLSEASVQGARRFLGAGEKFGPLTAFSSMTKGITFELLWRMLELIARPLLLRYWRLHVQDV